MAIAFRASSVGSGSDVKVTIPKIAGLADDDYVVIGVCKDDDLGGDFTQVTGTSGWTLEAQQSTTAGRDMRSCLARKLITDAASEPANWEFETTDTDRIAGIAMAFSGVDTGTPIDAAVQSANGTNDLTPDAPDITTVEDGAMVISFCACTDGAGVIGGSSITGGAPSELGGLVTEETQTVFVAMAYAEDASAGSFSIGSWTHTTDNATTEHHTWTIALKPAAGAAAAMPVVQGGYVGMMIAAAMSQAQQWLRHGSLYIPNRRLVTP